MGVYIATYRDIGINCLRLHLLPDVCPARRTGAPKRYHRCRRAPRSGHRLTVLSPTWPWLAGRRTATQPGAA